MKKTLHSVFTILIIVILIVKILSWFVNLGDSAEHILNTAMFSIIGVAYIVMAFVWSNRIIKSVILACGLYLIAMNFFDKAAVLTIIGIACMIIPMLITRLSKDSDSEQRITES